MTTPPRETAPRTLDEVERHESPLDRARAAVLYLDRLDERRVAALRVRDAAFVQARPATAGEVAAFAGVTESVVRHARRSAGRPGARR